MERITEVEIKIVGGADHKRRLNHIRCRDFNLKWEGVDVAQTNPNLKENFRYWVGVCLFYRSNEYMM